MVTSMRAVGFRARMGWAHVVVLDGVPGALQVADRQDVHLAPERGGYPYHSLADVAPEERDAVLAGAVDRVTDHVAGVVGGLLSDTAADAAGVVVGQGLRRIPIDKVLASSRLFHTAEGAVYYTAVATALERLGVRRATIAYGDAEGHPLWEAVTALRKQAGPPWTKDHKMAAVAAWLAATDGSR